VRPGLVDETAMHCTRCGSALDSTATFCHACGTGVAVLYAPPPPAYPPPAYAPAPSPAYAPAPPPYGGHQPPYATMQYTQPPYFPPARAATGNALSIVAIVLGCVSLVILPILFGPAAIVCAAIAKSKGERRSGVALGIAIAGMAIGMLIGAIVGAMGLI
jgi:hypothetical protein